MQDQPAAFGPAPRPPRPQCRAPSNLQAVSRCRATPPARAPPLQPLRAAPHAMSYRGRSRSRSRSRERGRDREDRGGERVSVLVRNLPLDAR